MRFQRYSEGLLIVGPHRLNMQKALETNEACGAWWRSGALTITGINVLCWMSPTGSHNTQDENKITSASQNAISSPLLDRTASLWKSCPVLDRPWTIGSPLFPSIRVVFLFSGRQPCGVRTLSLINGLIFAEEVGQNCVYPSGEK